MARVARSSRSGLAARCNTALRQYIEATPQPLYCLMILFPLVVTYEFGALMLRPLVWPEKYLVAQGAVASLFGWFGASGFWLPGVVLLLTLLIWHLLSGQSWQVRGWVLPLMLVESAALTLPLFVINRLSLAAALGIESPAMRVQIIMALGAGIYEELLFRLVLLTALMLLFVDVLRVPRGIAVGLSIVTATAAFALCHFQPIGSEPFAWPRLVTLAVSGAYLCALFIYRGLGISTGCHVAFNLILLLA